MKSVGAPTRFQRASIWTGLCMAWQNMQVCTSWAAFGPEVAAVLADRSCLELTTERARAEVIPARRMNAQSRIVFMVEPL